MKEMLATIHVRCASDTAFRSGAPTAAALAEVADLETSCEGHDTAVASLPPWSSGQVGILTRHCLRNTENTRHRLSYH